MADLNPLIEMDRGTRRGHDRSRPSRRISVCVAVRRYIRNAQPRSKRENPPSLALEQILGDCATGERATREVCWRSRFYGTRISDKARKAVQILIR
jgi:hypothetical protein